MAPTRTLDRERKNRMELSCHRSRIEGAGYVDLRVDKAYAFAESKLDRRPTTHGDGVLSCKRERERRGFWNGLALLKLRDDLGRRNLFPSVPLGDRATL